MIPFATEEETRLRTVIEAVPNGIIVVDDQGKISLCNSEAEKMFGYGHGELIGASIEVLVPSRVREKHPGLRESFQDHPSRRQMGAGRDLTGIRKDGVEIPVEIGLNPVKTEAGSFVIASVVNITERKRNEEKFRRDEDRFRIALESAPNGLVMVNATGEIVLCNTEAERMFGYEQGELIGRRVEDLVPMRLRGAHPGMRGHFHESPSKRQMGAGRDLSGVRKDGVEIPVEIGLNPIHTSDGPFVLASIVDITERKMGERRLHEAYRELQRRNQEMEQFVYTVSHDLRSPLVTTMAFVGFLKEDIAEGNLAEVGESLERIEKANRRMQQLIDDLLQLSRAGRMELEIEELDVNRVLAGVVEYVEPMAKDKGVRLDIAGDFPSISADRNRLHRVLENLIINAIKYGAGGTDPCIRVFWKDCGDDFCICVADNGQGIAPEYHKKIFALFQRLDTSEEGTGVGLAIVARIAELHGGRAWVESKPGEGAAFWVSFPKVYVPKEEPKTPCSRR